MDPAQRRVAHHFAGSIAAGLSADTSSPRNALSQKYRLAIKHAVAAAIPQGRDRTPTTKCAAPQSRQRQRWLGGCLVSRRLVRRLLMNFRSQASRTADDPDQQDRADEAGNQVADPSPKDDAEVHHCGRISGVLVPLLSARAKTLYFFSGPTEEVMDA